MNTVPLIDISKLLHGEPEDWQSIIAEIDHACRNIGFFYIKGHGISSDQMDDMFALAKQFFAQPESAKQKILIAKSSNHRGWGSAGVEQLDPSQPSDWKETFDMALDIHAEHPIANACPALYGPNQYGDLAGFQQTMNQHYGLLMSVAKRLLKAMAMALSLPDDFFNQYFDDQHISVLRMIHYPPRPNDLPASKTPTSEADKPTSEINAAGAHTDYGVITLLLQDDVGGLEVCNAQGEWVPAPPIKNTLVVNIGDLMQRWTNDFYLSTQHRVRNLSPGTHRYSMPFFVEPRYDTPVTCIPSCITPQRSARYPLITSGDWILSRFEATYAYRKER